MMRTGRQDSLGYFKSKKNDWFRRPEQWWTRFQNKDSLSLVKAPGIYWAYYLLG